MNDTPTISIVIPVYNVASYLRECLDSVRAQTFKDWECICVDDGSTDDSPAILDEYAAKDKRFRVICREHSNAGTCRNVGLDVARGEFLSFLDSDDIFAPRMMERMLRAALRFKASVTTCGMLPFKDGEPIPRLDKASPNSIECVDRPADTSDLFSKWAGRAWDKLFLRSFVQSKNLRFQEIRSTNDALFTYSALSLTPRVAHIPRALIAHRMSPTSLEQTRSLGAECLFDAIETYERDMSARGVIPCNVSLTQSFKRWLATIGFWYLDTIDTTDAYRRVHERFAQLIRDKQLDKLPEAVFTDHPGLYTRLERMAAGETPLETARFHERFLMESSNDIRESVARTKDYRLGSFLLCLPRAIWRRLHRKQMASSDRR